MKAELKLKGQKILIVGGGKQAVRKGKKLMEEQAEIMYCAPSFSQEIPHYQRICQPYKSSLLHDYFLVVACTDDESLNHQIVLDANKQHCFSASVHEDEDATFHFLREKKWEHLEVALTTKGASPAYGKRIMERIEKNYYNCDDKKLSMLNSIRRYVKKLKINQGQRTSFLKQLADEDMLWIAFLYKAIQQNQAVLLCFHGNMCDQFNIDPLEQIVKQAELPLYYAFLEDTKEKKSIDEVCQIMHLLQVPCSYGLVSVYQGKIHERMKEKLKGEHVFSCALNEEDVQQLIAQLSFCQDTVFVLHPSRHEEVLASLKNDWKWMYFHDEVPLLPQASIRFVPFVILEGKHSQDDMERIVKKAKQIYKHVKVFSPLMYVKEYHDILLDKIRKEFLFNDKKMC